MDYTGEHLLPGQLGHFFIVLSFVASLVATFAYFKSTQSKIDTEAGYWKKLARYAFITESISIITIFSILFYIIYNHLFEYKYAWQHSSRSLDFKYLLACFWEGQEGSFLLWSLWHCVLGLILIRVAKKWEAPVMTVISFVQVCLATMVAGIYIFGAKIGSNPFIMLRDSGVLDNAPALHLNFDVTQPLKQDYLSSITDGNGLNILLQNYWMVIHPPVLFLGFASTIIPFAYAIAGLWKKDFAGWIKSALPWALFSSAVLGVGIMMGAMWAYESLNFGGYWAWDPVENASLVPWMVLIAGIHTLLIYKHTGYSLRATYLFFILTFVLILYSTFLTRSGVLGETSVHAFTDLGMNLQLILFLFVFLVPAAFLLIREYKNIPAIKKEEATSAREFWMFIGSLVFFLSAAVIIGQTSVPVFNKIFGTKIAPPENVEFSYNSIQVYVAIILATLTATTQYLKYKQTPVKSFWKKILIPTIISIVLATLFFFTIGIQYDKQGVMFKAALWLATACSIYTIVANASYIWIGINGKLKLSGGSISHVGFGMVLLGILISSSNKEILSNNINGIPAPLGEGEDPRENLTLVKDLPVDMGNYKLTYINDSLHPNKEKTFFNIRFQNKNGTEDFVLSPNSYINFKGQEGLSSNPDARHYWNHDVFTYITSISNPDAEKDTASFKNTVSKPGDTVFYSTGFIVVQDVKKRENPPVELFGKDGSVHDVPIKVFAKTGSVYSSTVSFAVAKGSVIAMPDTIMAESLILRLQKVNPDKSIEMGVKESNAVMKYVTIKAYKFPFIIILWLGVAITAIGILMSMIRRIQLNRQTARQS
jgi:cytochrome c-type biogenesis protein CcmF